MSFKTMQQIVTAVERGLYQSAGPQVQLYSQELLMQIVQDAYDHVISGKDWWPQFYQRETRTLDGATGQITAVLTNIRQFDDVRYIFRDGSDRPLPILPLARNTLQFTGTTPKAVEQTSDSKFFRVWPLNATGQVLVVGRKRPASDFLFTDTVDFDHLALRYFALWSYFTDDEQLASAAKYQKLYEERISDLRDAAFSHPIVLDDKVDNVPDRWGEYPW